MDSGLKAVAPPVATQRVGTSRSGAHDDRFACQLPAGRGAPGGAGGKSLDRRASVVFSAFIAAVYRVRAPAAA